MDRHGSTRVHVPCIDLDAAMDFYMNELAFRLDMIMPADAPRIAELSGHGVTLRLERVGAPAPDPDGTGDPGSIVIQHASSVDAWSEGRAGMQYRDLVPGRLGGRFIASHIRIPGGGPVPDYVHYHRVGFQMIFCRRGWVRVVYEDQGPPFVMHAGDCVLQPPAIRHRVLEASPGLEVIEVGSPAEHETRRDHDLALPTSAAHSGRTFGGQRFVRHVAAVAHWQPAPEPGWTCRDTGIADATGGLAGVRVLRFAAGGAVPTAGTASARFDGIRFLFVLDGRLRLGNCTLEADDACLLPAGVPHAVEVEARGSCEMLEVRMPACAASNAAGAGPGA